MLSFTKETVQVLGVRSPQSEILMVKFVYSKRLPGGGDNEVFLTQIFCVSFSFSVYHSPTPHLRWRRDHEEIVDRGVTENYGKVLKIEQVTSADKGFYECIASNILGETKHEFAVHIEGTAFIITMVWF